MNLPDNNPHADRAAFFLKSKLQKRLARKYRHKPYEESYRPLYYIALVVSYFCNGISIATASSFVFSYVFSILSAVPNPFVFAVGFTGFVLVTIEVLQRTLAPKLFQNYFQFNSKALVVPIAILSIISITLSYLGSPEFVTLVQKPPVKQEVVLEDIEAIKTDYNNQIAQAREDANNFRDARVWRGRLSDADGNKYTALLASVDELREKKDQEVASAIERNQSSEAKAEEDYTQATLAYNSQVESRGVNLGIIAIMSQLVFFLCIGYIEWFDWRTIAQYIDRDGDHIFSFSAEREQNTFDDENDEKEEDNDYITVTEPKYTISHVSKKTGKLMHYNLAQVNRFIKTYKENLQKAKEAGNDHSMKINRDSMFYWMRKRIELMKKMNEE